VINVNLKLNNDGTKPLKRRVATVVGHHRIHHKGGVERSTLPAFRTPGPHFESSWQGGKVLGSSRPGAHPKDGHGKKSSWKKKKTSQKDGVRQKPHIKVRRGGGGGGLLQKHLERRQGGGRTRTLLTKSSGNRGAPIEEVCPGVGRGGGGEGSGEKKKSAASSSSY